MTLLYLPEHVEPALLALDLALLNARDATPMLFKVVSCIDSKAKELGLLG